MELGGNAPFIVFDDADMDAAIDWPWYQIWKLWPDLCGPPILVHENIYFDFLKLM